VRCYKTLCNETVLFLVGTHPGRNAVPNSIKFRASNKWKNVGRLMFDSTDEIYPLSFGDMSNRFLDVIGI